MLLKSKLFLTLLLLCSTLNANNAKSLYKSKCLMCHSTQTVKDKSTLIAPPADEIMVHVKEAYSSKEDAINFMVDYILKPELSKTLCASVDKFGLMPSMASTVTKEQARVISDMMYEKFPRKAYQEKNKKSRANVNFSSLDKNGDGAVSSKEFQNFRAKRNNIDPNSFKADLYFKKVDLNGDGKMDKEEFLQMKNEKTGN